MQNEFDYQVAGQPDYAYLKVNLKENQSIKAETSAMISMDTHIAMQTTFKGGFKRFLGGESIFINEFTAEKMPGEVCFATGLPGDIMALPVDDTTIFVQAGSYMASGKGITVDTKWQGMVKGIFSGAGLFLLRCHGKGDLFLTSYGGILEVDVNEEYIVDTNHILAFSDGLEYKISKVGGYKSLFFSGEGLVARFTGRGKLWLQTHQYPAFISWIYPFRPVKSSNN